NMSSSGQQTIYAETWLQHLGGTPGNNSPTIGNDTVLHACTQQFWSNFAQVSDPDGDSLSAMLVPCRQYSPPAIPTPITATNYAMPSTFGGGFFAGNAGEVYWDTPQALGLYAYAVEISKYRDGVKIGHMVYDATVIVNTGNCLVGDIEAEMEGTAVDIGPVPVKDVLNVRRNSAQKASVKVIGMDGKVHLKVENVMGDVHLDLGDLPAGVYGLEIRERGGVVYWKKFMKL
ncbi:MAG: T9SS type A sorting domain-containing protein, partial [Bacteroidota bacterium]